MNKADHIAKAEELLEAAKTVARRPKEDAHAKTQDEIIVLDLIGFANCHARIAIAIGSDGPRCHAGWEEPCVATMRGNCVTHPGAGCDVDINDTDGSDYN